MGKLKVLIKESADSKALCSRNMKMVSQGQFTDTDLIQRTVLHLKVTSGFSNILLMIHLF